MLSPADILALNRGRLDAGDASGTRPLSIEHLAVISGSGAAWLTNSAAPRPATVLGFLLSPIEPSAPAPYAWDAAGQRLSAHIRPLPAPAILNEIDNRFVSTHVRLLVMAAREDATEVLCEVYALREATKARLLVRENNVHADEKGGGMF